MSDWNDTVAAMDAAIFNTFGETATIAGTETTVIQDNERDELGIMISNGLRLSVPMDNNVIPKKGDEVIYKGKRRVILEPPEYRDGIILFSIK
jgi:hypothetical protein